MKSTASRQARNSLVAAYLGWTLDAFDFFIMVFVLTEVARTFAVPVSSVAVAITLTLACRAIGALLFGRLADRYGRRPILMLNMVCFAALEFASGFAPTLTVFLILRALYGVAMGGEWGVSGSLVMESAPPSRRGLDSGILQAGYPSGFLIASLLYLAMPVIGWRGMFMVGVLPALLVFYVRRQVDESPVWSALGDDKRKIGVIEALRGNLRVALFAIPLMAALNFLAHGSQDLFPSLFLRSEHALSTPMISAIMVVANLGALAGCVVFGALSDRIGRKRAIALASILALPVLPFWAAADTPLAIALSAFALQVCVQGAWGVVPAFLNELSPTTIRGTFPGFVYQAGNFIAAANANIQIWLAGHLGGNYGMAMAMTVGVMAVFIAGLMSVGPEPKGVSMDADPT